MRYAVIEERTFVGLDAHKQTIQAAMLLPGGEILDRKFANTPEGRTRLAKWARGKSVGRVACCYEAGPTGYVLQRDLLERGVECAVIAPSLTPRRPGDQVKTDKRDARKLATMLAAGMLTEVHPPTPEQEALRDLCRCRDDCRRAQHRARQQLLKFLDRRDLRSAHKPWTQAHRRWLSGLRLEDAASQFVLDQYRAAVDQHDARLVELDRALEAASEEEPHRAAVAALRCFRGIDMLTAVMLVAELYEFGRFESARSLMAYLGLVPSEDSSGESEERGSITKAGNRHVRRLLTEAAWHYRHRPVVGETLAKRRVGQPAAVVAIADRAMARLNRRFHRLVYRGKKPQVAATAVARELAGFVWSALRALESAA